MKRHSLQILSILFFLLCVSANSQENTSETYIIKDINIVGNKRTKNIVIKSELPFSEGSEINLDILEELIENAQNNLLNTSLFNTVNIDTQFFENNYLIFNVEVHERLFLWILPVFENEGRNFSDFLKFNDGSWYNYGIYAKHYNFRGRNEKISIRAITGYKDQLVFNYENPGRNNKSGWGFTYHWQENNQISYATVGDRLVFLKLKNRWAVNQNKIELNYFFRNNFYHYHRITTSFENIKISDSLFAVNPKFLPLEKQKSSQLVVTYNYKYDKRNLKFYPLTGNFVGASISGTGLGILSDYQGFFEAKFSLGIYRNLFKSFYWGTDFTLKGYSKKEIPYYFKAGFGYDDYLNGFEYKVIEGTFYSTVKNRLLFELIPRKDKSLKFIPAKQFKNFHYALYLSINADVGYVYNDLHLPYNKLPNSFLFGYGIGVELVTIYDKVLKLNYSLTNFGEHGIFIHFNLAM